MALTYEGLLNEQLIEHTTRTLQSSEKFTFYIDKTNGFESHNHYTIDQNSDTKYIKTIRTYNVGHNSIYERYIIEIFEKLDDIIDLDFEIMDHNNGSMLDIYHISYSSEFTSLVVGQAIKQSIKDGSWWDIFWKDSPLEITENPRVNQNTIIHEIGHTLGLSHPFNDPFNKEWDSEITIMSYNKGPNGWNDWFSDHDLNALIHIWGREDDLGVINYSGHSRDYKFKKSSPNHYFIKTELGYEDITNIKNLVFEDRSIEVEKDIIGVFDLIDNIDGIKSKLYRLYNAAFGRFPDRLGLEYWIETNISEQNNYKSTAKSFVSSKEFIDMYGSENQDNSTYINTLYENVLQRDPDKDGFNYWYAQLEKGLESKSEVLMGFSESSENKVIFSNETNVF